MANFSTFSSSSDSEIDQILAEAMDHCILEQVAEINCSSFSQSLLPSQLETRFQKLKTFPSSKSHLKDSNFKGNLGNLPSRQVKVSNFKGNLDEGEGKLPSGQVKVSNFERNLDESEGNLPSGQAKVSNFEGTLDEGEGKLGNLPSGQVKVSNFEGNSGGKKGKKGISQSGYVSSSSSDSSSEFRDSPKLKGGKNGVKSKMGISRAKSGLFCSDSEEEMTKKNGVGCLCFSPKRVSRRKSGGSRGGGELGFGWGKDEKLLSDLKSFSSKEQKKRMKEAMKEEEKINKEAERIVEWAKQVSARMDFDISEDDDDDFDSRHHFGLH